MSLLATTTIVPPLPLRLWPLCVDACVLSAFTLLILLLLLLLIKVGVVFISVRACLIGQLSFAYPPKLGNISIDCFYTCFYHQMCLVCAYYLLAPTVLHGGFGFEWGIYVVRCKVYLYIYMPFFFIRSNPSSSSLQPPVSSQLGDYSDEPESDQAPMLACHFNLNLFCWLI